MFCPQCGSESNSDQKFCRKCGANLALIFKAVKVSEAIARGDRGGLVDLRSWLEGIRSDRSFGPEIARGIAHLTTEIQRNLGKRHLREARENKEIHARRLGLRFRTPPTAEERREKAISRGVKTFFTGIGISIFLYFLVNAIIVSGEANPSEALLLRAVWMVGLIPTFAGLGRLLSGLCMRRDSLPERSIANMTEQGTPLATPTLNAASETAPHTSVTEFTTELLRDSWGTSPKAAEHAEKLEAASKRETRES